MKAFEVIFSSNIKEVNKVVRQAQNYIREAIPNVDNDELLDLRLILSELLFNAIIHGNKNNEKKLVRLHVWTEGTTVNASISDQGEGFDFSRLSYSGEPSTCEHGRGISLVEALADKIVFMKPGNKILFSKRVGLHV